MKFLIELVVYLVGAPLLGGLLAGVDRIVSARLQARVGPPLLQPFYDVGKLMQKEDLVVRGSQGYYILFFLIFMVFTGGLFFTGNDILLVIFSLTLAGIFFVLAGFKASSPYSQIGAERELIQMMAYEPMIILAAVGMYMVTRSFSVASIAGFGRPLIVYLPAIFIGTVYCFVIKFRKSPFDLSMSHHAHQEIVRGITTEFTGPSLAMIEVAHWYENAFLLGFAWLFFASFKLWGIAFVAVMYFFLILADNTFARIKWQPTLKISWLVALTLGLGNVAVLYFLRG